MRIGMNDEIEDFEPHICRAAQLTWYTYQDALQLRHSSLQDSLRYSYRLGEVEVSLNPRLMCANQIRGTHKLAPLINATPSSTRRT